MRSHTCWRAFLAPLFALLAASGCSQPTGAVSGEVSLDGKPVPTGYITFAPSDGKGPIAGGAVTNGRFDVPNVPLGPKLVSVQSSLPAAEKEVSSSDGYAKGTKAATAVPIQNAVGNGQPLDVVAGAQTFNVTLTTTKR